MANIAVSDRTARPVSEMNGRNASPTQSQPPHLPPTREADREGVREGEDRGGRDLRGRSGVRSGVGRLGVWVVRGGKLGVQGLGRKLEGG